MHLLYGNYDIAIDDKNRMLIPADIRKAKDPIADGEAFFLVPRGNGKLWLYPEKYYRTLAEQMSREMVPGEDLEKFNRVHFGLVSRVDWDRHGRVSLPEKEIRRAGLNREITVVGAGDHIEVWTRSDWAAQEEELLRQQTEIDERIRQRQREAGNAGL